MTCEIFVHCTALDRNQFQLYSGSLHSLTETRHRLLSLIQTMISGHVGVTCNERCHVADPGYKICVNWQQTLLLFKLNNGFLEVNSPSKKEYKLLALKNYNIFPLVANNRYVSKNLHHIQLLKLKGVCRIRF